MSIGWITVKSGCWMPKWFVNHNTDNQRWLKKLWGPLQCNWSMFINCANWPLVLNTFCEIKSIAFYGRHARKLNAIFWISNPTLKNRRIESKYMSNSKTISRMVFDIQLSKSMSVSQQAHIFKCHSLQKMKYMTCCCFKEHSHSF